MPESRPQEPVQLGWKAAVADFAVAAAASGSIRGSSHALFVLILLYPHALLVLLAQSLQLLALLLQLSAPRREASSTAGAEARGGTLRHGMAL
jgi:hypothetical protein